MVSFILCAFWDVPHALQRCMNSAATHKAQHRYSIFRIFYKVVWAFMFMTSSALVVTITKGIAIAFDCDDNQLVFAPTLRCFRGHHLILCAVLFMVTPLFTYVLLPYVPVYGDSSFVSADEILNPYLWRSNAERMAGAFFEGNLHPVKKNCFVTLFCDFWERILLTIVSVSLSRNPFLQTCILFFGTLIGLLVILRWAPAVGPMATVVKRGAKLLNCFGMGCAVFACLLDDSESPIPGLILWSGCAVILSSTIVIACKSERMKQMAIFIVAPDSETLENSPVVQIQPSYHSCCTQWP